MEVAEFLETIQNAILPIINYIESGQHEAALEEYRNKIGVVNGFVEFLVENQVVNEEDIKQMLELLIQALENKDVFLLEDILKYAILDIISQLKGDEKE